MEYAEIIETPNMKAEQRLLIGEYVRVNCINERTQRYAIHLDLRYVNGVKVTFTKNQLREITEDDFMKRNFPRGLRPGDFVKIVPGGYIPDDRRRHWWNVGYYYNAKRFIGVKFKIDRFEPGKNHAYVLTYPNGRYLYDVDESCLQKFAEEKTEYED